MKVKFEWISFTVEPVYDEPILAITKNDKLIVFKDTKTFYGGDVSTVHSGWKRLVEKYNIKYWVYQSHLLAQ